MVSSVISVFHVLEPGGVQRRVELGPFKVAGRFTIGNRRTGRPTGEARGIRHAVWRHPKKRHSIYVPIEELILDSTASTSSTRRKGKIA